jgi:hypothetical protein
LGYIRTFARTSETRRIQTPKELDNIKGTLSEKDDKIAEKDDKIKQLEFTNFQMQNFVTNVKTRSQTDYIYIVTTKQYAASNNFKIGHTENLVSRLNTYNTGQAINDKFYFCYTKRAYEAHKLDKLLHDLLIEFKDNKRKENVFYISHISLISSSLFQKTLMQVLHI